ncbi:MAG: lipid A biosynthesis acyltransferase, partial [Proteobacteria bacterium]|nr:lipid A biosynthesis acyltransferase [Pseudomonadota bacterium]
FMGIETATVPALPRLCRMTNAMVLPCYTKLLSNSEGFEIVIKPALKDYPGADNVEDVAIMNQAIEEMVREAPEQYFWLHKRFKTRPVGEPPFYQDA